MSEFMHVVVRVSGDRVADVKAFAESVAGKHSPIVGRQVARQWTEAAIDNPRSRFSRRKIGGKPMGAQVRYSFGSRGLGGGPGKYFQQASKRHRALRFVVAWLYPAPWIGEIGRQEFVAGKLAHEDYCYLEQDLGRFKALARRWLACHLAEDYPGAD